MKYKVRDIMSTPPITIKADASVQDAAKLMFENKIGSVLVVDDEGVLKGIITERDLVYIVASGKNIVASKYPVWQAMTEDPITIEPEDPITRAIAIMKEANIRHLPVVDKDKKPIGVISIRDVVNYIIELITQIKK